MPFTTLPPHTTHPAGEAFAAQLRTFASTCRVVKGMRRMTVGAIGARTTAFKTVRFDELALQRYGITTETLDLSEVIDRVQRMPDTDERVRARALFLSGYADCSTVPAPAQTQMAKLSIAIDDIISEFGMDAIAFRCWIELEKQLKIAPCLLMSEINNRGIPAACEIGRAHV